MATLIRFIIAALLLGGIQCSAPVAGGTGQSGNAIASGMIYTAENHPVTAAKVLFADSSYISSDTGKVVYSATTDSSGHFSLTLPKGRYRMSSLDSAGIIYRMVSITSSNDTSLGIIYQDSLHELVIDPSFVFAGKIDSITIPGTVWTYSTDSIGRFVYVPKDSTISLIAYSNGDSTNTFIVTDTSTSLVDPLLNYTPAFTVSYDSIAVSINVNVQNYNANYRYQAVLLDSIQGNPNDTLADTVISGTSQLIAYGFFIDTTVDSLTVLLRAGYIGSTTIVSQPASKKISIRSSNPILTFKPAFITGSVVDSVPDTLLFVKITNHVVGYQYQVSLSDSIGTNLLDTMTTDSSTFKLAGQSSNRQLSISVTARNGSTGAFNSLDSLAILNLNF